MSSRTISSGADSLTMYFHLFKELQYIGLLLKI
jgi:hypothetical protein